MTVEDGVVILLVWYLVWSLPRLINSELLPWLRNRGGLWPFNRRRT